MLTNKNTKTTNNEISGVKLSRVPNWGVVDIIPYTYDFSYEGDLLSRYRVHYYLDSYGKWKEGRRLLHVIGKEGGGGII